MREKFETGKLTEKDIEDIMSEGKPSQVEKLHLHADRIKNV
jgi:hypothetical protein